MFKVGWICFVAGGVLLFFGGFFFAIQTVFTVYSKDVKHTAYRQGPVCQSLLYGPLDVFAESESEERESEHTQKLLISWDLQEFTENGLKKEKRTGEVAQITFYYSQGTQKSISEHTTGQTLKQMHNSTLGAITVSLN